MYFNFEVGTAELLFWEWSHPCCSRSQVGRLKGLKLMTNITQCVLTSHKGLPHMNHKTSNIKGICARISVGINIHLQVTINMTEKATHQGQLSKKKLPWVGFEPTTLCVLGKHSTNYTIHTGAGLPDSSGSSRARPTWLYTGTCIQPRVTWTPKQVEWPRPIWSALCVGSLKGRNTLDTKYTT